MKKLALLVALASGAFTVSAQDAAIGVLQGVSGTVSVSGKNVVSRATTGTPVYEGSAILVSSSGKATLVLNSGCAVSLGANQHLSVSAKLPCEQMSASVKHLFPAYKVAQAPIGGGTTPPPPPPAPGFFAGLGGTGTLVPLGVLGVGTAFAVNSTNDKPVSGQ
jgi:hypothetical protein